MELEIYKNKWKHVKLTVDLDIGEKVKIDGFGYKLDGKICTITDIKFSPTCQSSVLVKVDMYDNYIDSDWITKTLK